MGDKQQGKAATRERILAEALVLFAEKGYHAASIRDIAKAVGIKDSSLYNHFKGKREIFEEVILFYARKGAKHIFPFYPEEWVSFATEGQQELPELVLTEEFRLLFQDAEVLSEYAARLLEQYVTDRESVLLRRLLLAEGSHDEPVKRISYEILYKGQLLFGKQLFSALFPEAAFDAESMAYQCLGPVYLLITEYESGESSLLEAKEKLKKHIVQLMGLYRQPVLENWR